jgi:hypothetical protein
MPINSFGSIAGRGDRTDYRWGAVNADANTRLYSIMCHKVGGQPGEVVVNGHASAGEFAGINTTAPAEPISTNTLEDLATLGVRAKNLTLALPPARVNLWAAPNTVFAEGDKLFADGRNDRVKVMPVGSSAQVIAICKEAKTTGADPETIQGELIAPGTIAGGYNVSAFGIDGVTDAKWLSVTWSNHAASVQGLFMAPADGVIKNLTAKLKTAAGGGKTITVTVHRSTDGGATFSATLLLVNIVDPAVIASNIANRVTVTKGDIFAIKVTTADPGAAAGLSAVFQYE